MADTRDDARASMTTRSEFLGKGVVLLSSIVAGAAALQACSREERNTSDAAEGLQALRATDPKLLGYREAARFDTGMAEPRGLAVGHDGTVYVVGDEAVHLFGIDGARRSAIPLAGPGQCVAPMGGHALAVAMLDHVELYDQAGGRTASWPSLGPRAQITGLACDEKSALIADSGSRLVYRVDAAGRVVAEIGRKDAATGYPGLVVPSPHLDVVGADGRAFVTNPGMHRVEEHSADGGLRSSWGVAASDIDSFCGCCNPTDIALLPDGRFVTAEKGIPRVKVYSAAGTFECVVAGPEAFASNTMGLDLAAAHDGRILVLDPRQRVVRVFAARGAAA